MLSRQQSGNMIAVPLMAKTLCDTWRRELIKPVVLGFTNNSVCLLKPELSYIEISHYSERPDLWILDHFDWDVTQQSIFFQLPPWNVKIGTVPTNDSHVQYN